MTFTTRKNRANLTHKDHSQAGFSLVELLIAMVIFLIVTSSIYGLLSLGTVSRNRSSRRTDVLKNARAAIHLIGRDALNAGLSYHQAGALVPDDFISDTLEVPVDKDDERDILTSVIPGNDLFQNSLQTSSTERTDIIAFAFRDMDFNGGDAKSLRNSLKGNSNEDLRIRFRSGAINKTDNVNPYDLVLVEADSTQVAAMVSDIVDTRNIDLKPTDPLGINLARNGIGIDRNLLRKCTRTILDNCTNSISSLKRFHWVSYRVKDDGTLVRKVYGNNTGRPFDEQIQEQPLAYNVKDLQFKYVLENGTVTENPTAGSDGVAGTTDDTPTDANLIRQITVTITVQSTEVDEKTGRPEEIKLSATFSARNLEYDQG